MSWRSLFPAEMSPLLALPEPDYQDFQSDECKFLRLSSRPNCVPGLCIAFLVPHTSLALCTFAFTLHHVASLFFSFRFCDRSLSEEPRTHHHIHWECLFPELSSTDYAQINSIVGVNRCLVLFHFFRNRRHARYIDGSMGSLEFLPQMNRL